MTKIPPSLPPSLPPGAHSLFGVIGADDYRYGRKLSEVWAPWEAELEVQCSRRGIGEWNQISLGSQGGYRQTRMVETIWAAGWGKTARVVWRGGRLAWEHQQPWMSMHGVWEADEGSVWLVRGEQWTVSWAGRWQRPGFSVHTLRAMRDDSRFGVIWGEGGAGLPGLFLQLHH